MKPCRSKNGSAVHCWSEDTAEDEAEVIAKTIRGLTKRGFRYRDIGILLRSVRTSSPPIIEAIRRNDIPFRCGGRTGLFLQPEAQTFGKLFAWLSGNSWKPDRYGTSSAVKLNDLLDEFVSVFSLNAKCRSKLRTQFDNWQTSAQDEDKMANLVGSFYQVLRAAGVYKWDFADPLMAARMGGLARFSQLLADFENVTRRGRRVAEKGSQTFRGGQNRGSWYYRRLFNYMQHYALDAYDDFEGEDAFDLDAIDILTVHEAKGLEWPVVFVPCLVNGRFPSRYAGKEQDWLLPRQVFSQATQDRYEGGETDERRLFYVAMTRAKEMLYLFRFRRKKNRFRPSPFLEEVAGCDPPEQKSLPLPPSIVPDNRHAADKPFVTFSELAAYEHMLRRIADQVQDQGQLPKADDIEQLFGQEFYLPVAHKPAFERLEAAAKSLVCTYLDKHGDDLLRVWETERDRATLRASPGKRHRIGACRCDPRSRERSEGRDGLDGL